MDYIEIRYRPQAGGPWKYLKAPANQDAITIAGVQRGESYVFEARNVSACGAASPWIQQTHVVSDSSSDPLPVAQGELLVNPGFELGNKYWVVPTEEDNGFGIVESNQRTGRYCARRRTYSYLSLPLSQPNAVFQNSKRFTVREGINVKLTVQIKGAGGANGNARARFTWLSSTGTEIAYSNTPNVSGNTAYVERVVQAIAPGGAAYGRVDLVVDGHTEGVYYFDDIVASVLTDNLDEVPDGDTYGRIMGEELENGQHLVGVPGSGYQVGDQRNLPAVNAGNVGSLWSGLTVSYTAAAGTPATATISVSAGTLLLGSTSVAYSASSKSITGTNATTVNHYLYYDDPIYAGGTKTLNSTTNPADIVSANGRIYVGAVAVAFPASGSSSGSGGTGGGGGACVAVDSYLPTGVQAGAAGVGSYLLLSGPAELALTYGAVTYSQAKPARCVRIVTEGGASLVCSTTAPIPTRAGSLTMAPALLGLEVPVLRAGAAGWERVVAVEPAGTRRVQHITVGDRCFWAGERADAFILHHNAKPALEN